MVTALTRKNGFLVGLENLDEPSIQKRAYSSGFCVGSNPALSVSDIRDGEDR